MKKKFQPIIRSKIEHFLDIEPEMLRCILKGRRSVQVSQALTTSSKENSLILGGILGNNSEKKRKIEEQIASLAEGETCKSEVLCPGTWMTRQRTLIKKDALSYYMDNDFDQKI